MNPTVYDLNRLNDNHQKYNSEELNKIYSQHDRKVKNYYKHIGNDLSYKIIAEDKNLTSGLEKRSADRKQKIKDLNSYLKNKIVLRSNENPYYDNSFKYEGNESENTIDSDQVFKKYENELENNQRGGAQQDNLESNRQQYSGPRNEAERSNFSTNFSQRNNRLGNPLLESGLDYKQRIRNFGIEGTERKNNFKRQADDLPDFLLHQIQSKKLREEQERQRLKLEDEKLERRNREYFDRLENEGGDQFSQAGSATNNGERNSKKTFQKNSKNVLMQDISRIGSSHHEDSLQGSIENLRSPNLETDSLDQLEVGEVGEGGDKTSERRYESLEELKKRNIEQTMQVRRNAREMFHNINRLAEQRHKIKAQEAYSRQKHAQALNDFKSISEELMGYRMSLGIDLAAKNLKNSMWMKKKR